MSYTKLEFEVNKPALVALRFDDGKDVEGRWGDQVMYSLESGHVMYVPPIVRQYIEQLGIKRGEQFQIEKREVKDGQKRKIQWQVNRPAGATPAVAAPTPAPAATAQFPAPNGSTGAGANGAPRVPVAPPPPAAAQAPTDALSVVGATMAGCLREAVDAAEAAEQYALEKGYALPVRFGADDIRTLAVTLFINFQGARR